MLEIYFIRWFSTFRFLFSALYLFHLIHNKWVNCLSAYPNKYSTFNTQVKKSKMKVYDKIEAEANFYYLENYLWESFVYLRNKISLKICKFEKKNSFRHSISIFGACSLKSIYHYNRQTIYTFSISNWISNWN